jgi:sugar diacid utilization regulator
MVRAGMKSIMDFELLRVKLESILHHKVMIEERSVHAHSSATQQYTRIQIDKNVDLVIDGQVTEVERNLVSLLFTQIPPALADDEQQIRRLSGWLIERLAENQIEAALPNILQQWPALRKPKVPLLLYGDFREDNQTSYPELQKLLKSFFETEITLIPLEIKEWLILGDESLLSSGREEGEESIEETLSALASALHDMVASEWMGECHVATTYPFEPAVSLLKVTASLREAMILGRTYRISSNVHLPWELRLETLLHTLNAQAQITFIKGILHPENDELDRGGMGGDEIDGEMLATLETFFMENCNVSDTAKRLYIHRNTLLYRLDKFKQETGMDVRNFDHAILVKLALLLYKVTKRK